ncbi:MAG: hypothetical protein IIY50_06120, partial [Mogibacterium sp.]|nr:hypothetical protein [Mogibacterium sp.]
ITALVETQVDPADQPAAASWIMAQNPEVEQVGFVTFAAAGAGAPVADVPVSLRMAGGEFCGNATMCSAALYMIVNDMPGEANVKVRVSGTKEPLDVRLVRRDAVSFDAAVTMPPAVGIDELKLSDGMLPGNDVLRLPVVRMEGIAHVIIEPDSGFFGLKDDSALAETLLRGWCGVLGAECLGMMFLDEGKGVRALTPLVYVPGADTMFWENSCASGSAAAGMYLAAKEGKPVDVTFSEPAGSLRVTSDPDRGRTVLYGSLTLN